jgi:four helix bundle protein
LIADKKIKSFEDLIVWQKAVELSVEVYKLSRNFPKEEIFGLTAQIRRASNSISLNIAEGTVKSTKSYINHLKTAAGSASEVLSAAILAYKLELVSETDLIKIRGKVAEELKMIYKMVDSLNLKIRKSYSDITAVSITNH